MKCKFVTRVIKMICIQDTQLWFCYLGLFLFLQYKLLPKLVMIFYMVVFIKINALCIKTSNRAICLQKCF